MPSQLFRAAILNVAFSLWLTRLIIVLSILTLGAGSAHAVIGELPVCPGNRTAYSMYTALQAGAPLGYYDTQTPFAEHGVYQVPAAQQYAAFAGAIQQLAGGDVFGAKAVLEDLLIGMTLCRPADMPDAALVYDPEGFLRTESRGWPMVLVRPSATAPALVLSAPHATNEFNVGKQLTDFFAQPETRALGLVLAMVDRCNRLEAAPEIYQAPTTSCPDGNGANARYRISDMAHNGNTLFQAAHDGLMAARPDALMMQVHGMAGSLSRGIRVSRGGDLDDDPDRPVPYPETAVARIHVAMSDFLIANGYLQIDNDGSGHSIVTTIDDLTTCSYHTGPGGNRFRDHYCGGNRNAQYALLSAEQKTRFIHLELGSEIRKVNPGLFFAGALAAAFREYVSYIFRDSLETPPATVTSSASPPGGGGE